MSAPPDARRAVRHVEEFREQVLAGIKRRIRECLGPQPKSIARYYRAYVRVFRSAIEPCRYEDLLRSAERAQVVYVGDFHTNSAAQRAEAELLRHLVERGRRVALAVEMFAAEDQELVDRYMDGRIDEATFLRQIRYQQTWGFRWASYRRLLAAAREHDVPVVALNAKADAALATRDRLAASRIARLLSDDPSRLVMVVYGDLHLATSHLPRELEKAAARGGARTIVYQNSETIERRLRQAGQDGAHVVRLGENRFCLQNTSILVKMQGFLSWLQNSERSFDRATSEIRLGEEGEGELEEDFQALGKELAAFFGLEAPDLDAADLRVLGDLAFLEDIADRRAATAYALRIRNRRPVVTADPPVVYLPDTDLLTQVAGAMALVLVTASGDDRRANHRSSSFHRRLLDRAFEAFALRLVHPAQRTITIPGLRNLAESQGTEPLSRKLAQRLVVARHLPDFLAHLERGEKVPAEQLATLARVDRRTGFELSALAGEWLGHRLFEAYRAGRIRLDILRAAIEHGWTEARAKEHIREWR